MGLGLLTLGAGAQSRPANFPVPTPAPVLSRVLHSGTPGTYQDLAGNWHEARIAEWENYRVYISEADGLSRVYSPSELKRFVFVRYADTVVTAFDVAVPRRRFLRRPKPTLRPALFARQLYHGGGFQLLDYDPVRQSDLLSRLNSSLLLRRTGQPWQLVPTGQTDFNQFMLAQVGDCPALAPGLRAGEYHARRDVVALLERYADWQLRRQLQTAAQSTN